MYECHNDSRITMRGLQISLNCINKKTFFFVISLAQFCTWCILEPNPPISFSIFLYVNPVPSR